MRYFALKTRLMNIIASNAMKALKNVQMHELCKIRLSNAKTSICLRLNAFLFRAKNAFHAYYRF